MIQYSAVIIASGRASRLGAVCERRPKCMLPFGGVPFLRYLIFWLLRNGIGEIIVTGSNVCGGWLIEEEIRNNFPLHVRFVMEDYPRSTVYSSFVGVSEVTNKHTLLLTGDNIWDVNLQQVCKKHIQKKASCSVLVTTKKNVPNHGLVKVDKKTKRVISFHDKDSRCIGKSASTMGFYVLDAQQFLTVVNLSQDIYVERESLGRLIPDAWSIVNNKFFFDFGTPDSLEFLSKNHDIVARYFGFPKLY